MVSKWKFWTWGHWLNYLRDSFSGLASFYSDIQTRQERCEAELRHLRMQLSQMQNTKQDHNIRTLALERRFDRLEELIRKEADALKMGGDLTRVGEDFMRRFMADGQRYLDEYEDLLEAKRPK